MKHVKKVISIYMVLVLIVLMSSIRVVYAQSATSKEELLALLEDCIEVNDYLFELYPNAGPTDPSNTIPSTDETITFVTDPTEITIESTSESISQLHTTTNPKESSVFTTGFYTTQVLEPTESTTEYQSSPTDPSEPDVTGYPTVDPSTSEPDIAKELEELFKTMQNTLERANTLLNDPEADEQEITGIIRELKVIQETAAKFFILGDSNLDGKVNIRDATHIQKYIIGKIKISDLSYKQSDVNHDGKVNIRDATFIQRKLLS